MAAQSTDVGLANIKSNARKEGPHQTHFLKLYGNNNE
jgi:hypothetical protein